MRIQLIHPPVYVNARALTALRPGLPLGLAYIAAACERAGHGVGVLDAVGEAPRQVTRDGDLDVLGLTPAQIAERIDPDARLIGVTNMWSFSWPLVRDAIRRIRAARPDVRIVGGGEHFSGLPELSLEQAPLDYVVRGEGEETLTELLAGLEREQAGLPFDPSTVAGLSWRDGERIVSNPARARVRDVNALPWPAWQHFDVEGYYRANLITGLDQGLTVPILATRGCPYQCTYCASPGMWTTRWIPRDPTDVVDEIESYVTRYGARNFPFQDLTAITKRRWIVDFCNELLARGLDVRWQFPSGTRCEVIDDEVAELLAHTGGRSLAFAPESGSEETREKIKKQMKTESLIGAVEASVRHGLNITAFVVIGFPHDTHESLAESRALARTLGRLGIDDLAIGYFFPIPATELFRELMAEGRISLDDESLKTPMRANEGALEERNNYCRALSARELTRWKLRIHLAFYLSSARHHPVKLLRLAGNLLAGRETRKMETVLLDGFRKLKLRLRPASGLGPA